LYSKDTQYRKFCTYGFLKNLRFFDAFLLLFFLESGLTYANIGILYAAREIITNLAEIPSGIIADTYGRKKSLLGSFAVYILSFLIFYFSANFTMLLMAMLCYGLGDAFRSGTHKGMIMDYLNLNHWQEHKVDYYGHTRSWSQLGSALSSLAAGFLVMYTGSYRFVFLFALLPYFLNLLNVASYPSEINFSSKKRSGHNTLRSVVKNFAAMLKKREVLRVINSAAIHTSFLKAIKDYIQPIMVSIAIMTPILLTMEEKKKSGLIVGILYFIIYLLSSYASKNSNRFYNLKFKNVTTFSILIGLFTGAICGIMFQMEFWLLSFILFVVIFVVENLRKPILTGVLSNNVPNEILTSVISAESFYASIITSVLALILGFSADTFGVGVGLIAVSLLLILVLFMVGSPRDR
jgi:MFS family permease